ncbi:MAG: ComEC/Rec2 family competence protein [Candidatus Paceibacterota bacterium]
MRYKISLIFLSAWVLGVSLGSGSVSTFPLLFWVLTPFLTFLTLPSKRYIALIVGVFLFSFAYSHLSRQIAWRSFKAGKASFSATVVAPPDYRQKNTNLLVETKEPIAHNLWGKPAKGRVLVRADRYLPVRFGDEIHITSTLEKPEPFEGFNYPLFLERDGIFAIAPRAEVSVISSSRNFSLVAGLAELRHTFERSIGKYVPEPEGSFLCGLLFGSKRAIPTDVSDALKATGTSHLVAISGANITFIVSIALSLLPVSNRTFQAVTVILLSTWLTLLSGSSSSVTRGAVIASMNAVVKASGRRAWALPGIILAASVMLLFNPLLLISDPGFQLSFAAYGGLLMFGNVLQKASTKLALPTWMAGSFSETGAASLGTAPLTLLSGSFALRGLVINPLVLWLIPPATALGFVLLGFSWFPPLATVLGIAAWAILHFALWIIKTGGGI